MPYIPDVFVVIFAVFIAVAVWFVARSIRAGKTQLIHRLYYMISIIIILWQLMIIELRFTDPANLPLVRVWDNLMYLGTFAPVLMLLLVLAFVRGWQRLPSAYYCLFIVPVLSNIMVWTNPLHGLVYQTFSLDISEVVFGPYVVFSGMYAMVCGIVAMVFLIYFTVTHRSQLVVKQATLFCIGTAVPFLTNVLATANLLPLGIVATPLSFIATIVLNGIAIYRYHFLDIRPIAVQNVLGWMADGYLLISRDGLVMEYNKLFYSVFGLRYGIEENAYLDDVLKKLEPAKWAGLYSLVTAIESSRTADSPISYEQALFLQEGREAAKRYYMVEITPLKVRDETEGFVIYFKDITTLKESMARQQAIQARMMEQERLASLGQLVAGLAHNLKTPIMSISGSTLALENLVEECRLSLGDPEVTPEDYIEIYGEMSEWTTRLRDACTYMSDIISAVKGQAKNLDATDDDGEFTLDQLVKMVSLLLRHELLSSGCQLAVENHMDRDFRFTGDINILVQVVDNLVNNAIYAVKESPSKAITIGVERDDKMLKLYVRDRGPGIAPEIKARLFKQMTTSKGTDGTGLGLYISSAVVHAKFGGELWVEDAPGGGTVFWISIPLERILMDPQEPGRVAGAGGIL